MTKPDIAEARRLADELESNRVAGRASPVLRALADEVERLRRGELICGRCGLRKDAEQAGAAPF